MLAEALRLEAADYLEMHRGVRGEYGRALVEPAAGLVSEGTLQFRLQSALSELLGEETTAGHSASAIVALKRAWDREYDQWSKRQITEKFVYVFADGIHVSVRLGEDKKLCLVVLIDVNECGEKRLLAVEAGFRESKDSWKAVLSDLAVRGLQAPVLAIGDGALGFWAALRECDEYRTTREQRCWSHKMSNVLNALPERLQGTAELG